MPEPAANPPKVVAIPLSWGQVLADFPPGKEYDVFDLTVEDQYGRFELDRPLIDLHCDSDPCQREMIAECRDSSTWLNKAWNDVFLTYRCRNCGKTLKVFAVHVMRGASTDGKAVKVGEWPLFSPHIPTKLQTVLGRDWGEFVQGRRAESQGMGVGAFAYYRRVVERRKDRLIAEIIKVAAKVNAPPDVMASLQAAANETQFKKALETVKVPESLLIDGHNPLTLLHSATSDGLHDKSDEECLDDAQAIRHVLVELAQRIDLALKAHEDLKASVGKLLQKQAKKKEGIPRS